jgi:hypothetical protein
LSPPHTASHSSRVPDTHTRPGNRAYLGIAPDWRSRRRRTPGVQRPWRTPHRQATPATPPRRALPPPCHRHPAESPLVPPFLQRRSAPRWAADAPAASSHTSNARGASTTGPRAGDRCFKPDHPLMAPPANPRSRSPCRRAAADGAPAVDPTDPAGLAIHRAPTPPRQRSA